MHRMADDGSAFQRIHGDDVLLTRNACCTECCRAQTSKQLYNIPYGDVVAGGAPRRQQGLVALAEL